LSEGCYSQGSLNPLIWIDTDYIPSTNFQKIMLKIVAKRFTQRLRKEIKKREKNVALMLIKNYFIT